MKRTLTPSAILWPLFGIVASLLVGCGGSSGPGGDQAESGLMPYVTYESGHLTLHIVNMTSSTITNVRVVYTMPDELFVASSLTTSCEGSMATIPEGPFGQPLVGDITLTVPAMSAAQDCVVEMETITHATSQTIKVLRGDATADGGLSNHEEYQYTIHRAP